MTANPTPDLPTGRDLELHAFIHGGLVRCDRCGREPLDEYLASRPAGGYDDRPFAAWLLAQGWAYEQCRLTCPPCQRKHRPVRHSVFTLCSIVSLLLCAAVCVIWPLSYWRTFDAWRQHNESDAARVRYQTQGLGADNGRLYVRVADVSFSRIGASGIDQLSIPATWETWGPYRWRNYSVSCRRALRWTEWNYADRSDFEGRPTLAGVTYQSSSYGGDTVAIPFLYLVILLFLPPAARVQSYRRSRGRFTRSRAGMCPACGYDLRATPACCPECGTEPRVPSA